MQLGELTHGAREPALPMVLQLGGDELFLERLLRVLPGQRYVGVAQWRGRRVLAKLLVGSRASRHFQREVSGARLLAEHGLATPQLLAEGLVDGEGGWLLFDYLEGAASLWGVWRDVAREPLLSEAQQTVLGEALAAIAQMHAKGLWQSDLHLDNLLRHAGQLFVIDGGGVQVEAPGQPLSRAKVLENLGVFFAQLPVELTPFTEELLVHYLLANGEHALPLEALLKEVSKVRRWRLRDYLRKIGRDCSLFSAKLNAFGLRVVRRDVQADLLPLLDNPDSYIAGGHVFKDGGSSTVAKVELAGRTLLVKRNNVKSFAHWLRRFWRPSRAWHSWVEGNRLDFLGIATPKPLAVIERRWCWLRFGGYVITEYTVARDLFALFGTDGSRLPEPDEAQALQMLFERLLRERISHGDFKATNLLWDNGQILLIDLDAMQAHANTSAWRKAYAEDRARFIRNWPSTSPLAQWLGEQLPLLDGPDRLHAAAAGRG